MSAAETLKYIRDILTIIYSTKEAESVFRSIKNLMDVYARDVIIQGKRAKYNDRVVISEKDAIVATYADTIYNDKEKPLKTLRRFLHEYIGDAVTGVHILPFFPSSSDAGYSVVDYKDVDPRFGTWEDIKELASEYRIMVDLVINHVSSQSKWFQRFLRGDKRYTSYFIPYDAHIDLPSVFRPRSHPLLTEFDTAIGKKYLWTTFSPDQIDLNFKNPQVLYKIIDILLYYLSQGIEIIRLDAIGYIWKEPNTSCVNLSKTHQIVKLLRRILEYVAPYALIVT